MVGNGDLICIIGPDGTGKTLHALKLVEALQHRGFKAKYTWLRMNHFLSLIPLGGARILGLTLNWEVNRRRMSQPRLGRAKFLGGLYALLFVIDYFIAYFVKVRMARILGRVLVADRFAHDALVDLSIILQHDRIEETFYGQILTRLARQATVTLRLKVEDDEILRRRPEHLRDPFLEKRSRLYDRLGAYFGMSTINSSGSPEETFRKVLKLVGLNGTT